jgi:hypothetical protein
MRCCLLVLLLATCASAFVAVAPPSGAVVARSSTLAPTVSMTSANKQAKAKTQKLKTSSAARKRFKVTASGKLLRHVCAPVTRS